MSCSFSHLLLHGRYFQGIQGVQHIEAGHNPATWMLDISTVTAQERAGADLAEVYAGSQQRRCACFSGHLSCSAPTCTILLHCAAVMSAGECMAVTCARI